MKNHHDVIIVGSGFGGSVSALRLTEKGYKVLIIEKGKRFSDKDFPQTNWNLKKYLWMPNLFLYGIQCITFLKNVFILHGCGVGGGSLVYANTLLIPSHKVFKDEKWPGSDWYKKLEPFYKISKNMLGAIKASFLGETDQLLKKTAEEMGREDTFYPVDVGVYFGNPDKIHPDPYFNGKGPERKGCILCGGCMGGCRHNAKNTLVKNYLYLAEKNGAEILPEKEVISIEKINNKYKIIIKKSTGIIRNKQILYCDKLILSGGVMGTVKLLLKSKLNGTLPKISNKLGDYVRTNSEAIIGTSTYTKPKNKDYTKGIAISAGFHPDDKTTIETVRFGKGQDAMGRLSTLMIKSNAKLPSFIQFIWNIIRHPIQFIITLWPFGWAKKTVILLVMQPISNYLKLNYKRRWWRLGFRSFNSHLSKKGTLPGKIPIGEDVAESIINRIGGFTMAAIPNSLFNIPTTAHILGGCIMGNNQDAGVVNEKLEVFNYPGMYIIDGSVIPSNLGVNPSLTITAISEYAMSHFPNKIG